LFNLIAPALNRVKEFVTAAGDSCYKVSCNLV